MSILSTSSKLVRVGDSYSAGEGISIENNTISVTGDYGHAYSAGDNITISDDHIISSKDWSSDITAASANSYNETTAWVDSQGFITDADLGDYALKTDVETTSGLLKLDIDEVSGSVSSKLDTTAFTTWQNGQYSNDIGGLANNIDTVSGAVDAISGVVSGLDIPTHQEIIEASGYAYSQSTAWTDSQGYLTEHQPISAAEWNESYETVLANSAQWSENTGDEDVNNAVYNNSAKWNDIEVYQTNSSTYITAHQDISNKLDTTAFSTVSGTFLTAHQSLDGYLTKTSADTLYQPIGNYASENDLEQVSGALQNDIDYISGVAITAHQDISNKLDTTAFSTVSGTFLTAHQSLDGYLTKSSADTLYQPVGSYASQTDLEQVSGVLKSDIDYISGVAITAHQDLSNYATTGDLNTASSFLSGAIDYVSGQIPVIPDISATEWNSVYDSVESNSAKWNEISVYETNSANYLTAHQDISNKLDTTAFSTVSGTFLTGINIPESATWNDVASVYQSNSSTYLTAETDWTNTITAASSYAYNEAVAQIPAPFDPTYMSGAIDYISGVAITALPGDLATTGDVNDLAQSISETYQVKGDYLTTADSSNFYPMTGNPSGFLTSHQDISNKLDTTAFSDVSGTFLTAVDLSNYYTKSETSGATELANAFSNIPAGDVEVNTYVHNNSATINDVNTTVQTNSATWGQGGGGTSLTGDAQGAVDEVYANSANWNDNYTTVNSNSSTWTNGGFTGEVYGISGVSPNVDVYIDQQTLWISAGGFLTAHQDLSNYATTGDVETISSFLSGAIDYVSANAGGEFPASANDAITAYQNASGTYLTAHQDLSDYVPMSSYNELKQSYDALSSLFATYSGQWLLPNEYVAPQPDPEPSYITCPDCGGTGKDENSTTTCSRCGGNGQDPEHTHEETCPTCNGDGQDPGGGYEDTCSECGGTGTYDYGEGEETCQRCGGSGTEWVTTCNSCGGGGTIWVADSCTECGGTGVIYDDCQTCNGTGQIEDNQGE